MPVEISQKGCRIAVEMMNLGRQPADKIACGGSVSFCGAEASLVEGLGPTRYSCRFLQSCSYRAMGPRWTFMWTLAVAIYCGCKWLTWRRTPLHEKTLSGSAVLPAGLARARCAPFINTFRFPVKLRPNRGEWLFAAANLRLVFGCFSGWQGALLFIRSIGPAGSVWSVFIMTLHFGLFHIVSCGWRSIGNKGGAVDALADPGAECQRLLGKPLERRLPGSYTSVYFSAVELQFGPRWAIVAVLFSAALFTTWLFPYRLVGVCGPTLFFSLQCMALFLDAATSGDGWV